MWTCETCVYYSEIFYHYNKTNEASIVHTFNPEFFSQYKELYKQLENFIATKKFSEEYESALKNRIIINLITMFLNYSKDKNIWKSRKDLVEILNDSIYRDAFKSFNYGTLPVMYKCFFFMCNKKIVLLPLIGINIINKIGYRKQ